MTKQHTWMYSAIMTLSMMTFVSSGFVATPAGARNSRHDKDARTCTGFGYSYGTLPFSDCMLEQQRRRDAKERDTLEKMALTSQIAKDGQITAERARRQRCDRNPDRRECRR